VGWIVYVGRVTQGLLCDSHPAFETNGTENSRLVFHRPALLAEVHEIRERKALYTILFSKFQTKMFCLTIPVLTLWVAMLACITCSEAADYSSVCLDPADYNGSTVYAGTTTCDAYLTSSSGCVGCAGQVFENVSWPNPTCSNFTATGSAVNTLFYVATKCCGGKKSVCAKDYSRMCKDPSKYVGTNIAIYIASGNVNCDNALAYFTDFPSGYFYGINWSNDTCSAFTGNTRTSLDAFARLCCSDEKSLCAQDYSKVCKNPANYNGSAVYSSTTTCDAAMAIFTMPSPTVHQNIWENVSWPNPTCAEFADAPQYTGGLSPLMTIGDKCCSDKQDVCAPAPDAYKVICKTPSDYSPNANIMGSSMRCEDFLRAYSFPTLPFDQVNWATATCATLKTTPLTGQTSGNNVAQLFNSGYFDDCCSNKPLCGGRDYQYFCKTPSNYDGAAQTTSPTQSVCEVTMKQAFGSSTFQNVNFNSSMTCGDVLGQIPESERESRKLGLVFSLSACCTDGITVCNVPSEDASTSGSMGNGEGSGAMLFAVVTWSSLLTIMV
jgi:hypothetical protein